MNVAAAFVHCLDLVVFVGAHWFVHYLGRLCFQNEVGPRTLDEKEYRVPEVGHWLRSSMVFQASRPRPVHVDITL